MACTAGAICPKGGNRPQPHAIGSFECEYSPRNSSLFPSGMRLGSSVEEVLDDAHQILLSEYRDNVLARSGAVELARRLSGDGVKLAVASSSPVDFLQAGLERAGIFDLFDVVASAEGEGRTKSDPSSAQASLSGLAQIPPTAGVLTIRRMHWAQWRRRAL